MVVFQICDVTKLPAQCPPDLLLHIPQSSGEGIAYAQEGEGPICCVSTFTTNQNYQLGL